MQVKKIAARLLMSFVLVSVGFAIGKEVTLRRLGASADPAALPQTQDHLIVYYMHGAFRCVTCNTIESLTREIAEKDFAAAAAEGRIVYRSVNFHENTAMARRYDVSASTVVLVQMRGGRELHFERLDDIWNHISDSQACRAYIAERIGSRLLEAQGDRDGEQQ